MRQRPWRKTPIYAEEEISFAFSAKGAALFKAWGIAQGDFIGAKGIGERLQPLKELFGSP